ncbi:uncharacterized protein PG998_000433 [Apiospora kogelbergensis]|uniref:uncharacterized protein n=1 Tax=Apiospora kogelbergensis TaxID=1337665 RepID=UPI0031301A7B
MGDTFPVENTSTIVLTSPKRHFVDVRLRIPLQKEGGSQQLDWAFAGTSSHDAAASPPHSVFRHWVDSRHEDAEAVVDEGDMVPSQNPGETVESGSMVNPDTGVLQPYEECWLDGEPGPGEASGGWGVLRVGKEVAVGRWEMVAGAPSWTAVAEIGGMAGTGFPTGLATTPAVGEKVQAQDGRQWVCLEAW